MSNRTQIHATFTLEREYPATVEQVWEAFADAEIRDKWFGSGDFEYTDRQHDLRVGGITTDDGHHGEGGPLSQFHATYTDIVPNERIVYSYDMWLDGAHASTSITTIVLEPISDGTRLTFTEQGVHLDGIHGPGPDAAAGREQGTSDLLDKIGDLFTTR